MMTGVANVKPNVISRFISCALFAQWIYMEEIDTMFSISCRDCKHNC